MSEFCKQCSVKIFGEDTKDLTGISEIPMFEDEVIPALCEGCGPTLVDLHGNCKGDCDEGHGNIEI